MEIVNSKRLCMSRIAGGVVRAPSLKQAGPSSSAEQVNADHELIVGALESQKKGQEPQEGK